MAANQTNFEEDDQQEQSTAAGGIKDILAKYKKYIATGAMLVLLAVVIFFSNMVAKEDKTPQGGQTAQTGLGTEEFEVDANPQVSNLIGEYFDFYAKGDVDSIEQIAYPITDSEKSYIKMFSKYLEKYENIKCYTKDGAADGEYVVFVSHDMKFKDIETGAPGLSSFYVRKDEDGAVHIDNAYSQYNQTKKETKTDEKISTLLAESGQSKDMTKLLEEIQQGYDSALEKDQALKKMVTSTIRDSVTGFQTQDSSDGTSANQTQKRTAYAKTDVNMRKKRSTDSEVVKTLKAGAKVTIYGVSKNGWFKVKNAGDTGYVKKEYLVSSKGKTENAAENTSADNSVKKRTAYAKTQVNLRKKRSTDSEIIRTLKAGAKVTVYGASRDGWYQVKAGSDTGYVKKEYIVSDKSKVEKESQTDSAANTNKKTAYAKTQVNLRKERSTQSEILATIGAGTKVTVYGSASGGWYRVKADGKTGYIRTEYIVSDLSGVEQAQGSQQTSSSTSRYFHEGDTIRLSESVNVRQSIGESANLVGMAYQGDVVTVIMSYAEGWTRVSWNGKTGYIKTDLLK